MALSTPFGIQKQDMEFAWEGRVSGCDLASLLSEYLTLYLDVEKTHWHLRLAVAGPDNFEPDRCTEMAREVCAVVLRIISGIARLQLAIHPDPEPECKTLLAAVAEKIAENRELANQWA